MFSGIFIFKPKKSQFIFFTEWSNCLNYYKFDQMYIAIAFTYICSRFVMLFFSEFGREVVSYLSQISLYHNNRICCDVWQLLCIYFLFSITVNSFRLSLQKLHIMIFGWIPLFLLFFLKKTNITEFLMRFWISVITFLRSCSIISLFK